MILLFIVEIYIIVFELKFWFRLILIFFFGIVDVCVMIVFGINSKKNKICLMIFIGFWLFYGIILWIVKGWL